MNRPLLVLQQALAEDLQPMVHRLREMGWPAEVWVVAESADNPHGYHMAIRVKLPRLPIPVESVEKRDSVTGGNGG